jgi:hypothetical protein
VGKKIYGGELGFETGTYESPSKDEGKAPPEDMLAMFGKELGSSCEDVLRRLKW